MRDDLGRVFVTGVSGVVDLAREGESRPATPAGRPAAGRSPISAREGEPG